MSRITINTTMKDLMDLPQFKEIRQFLLYSPGIDEIPEDSEAQQTVQKLQQAPLSAVAAIGWSPEGMAAGANFLLDAIDGGRVFLHRVYEPAVSDDDPAKKDVNLIRIVPEHLDPHKPYIILCSGGAYRSVCTLTEGMPTARHFSEAGYQVFLFTYRVNIPQATLCALDDLAEAIRYIGKHSLDFSVAPGRYAIGGFSAGANLISNWGCSHTGYLHYRLPKPLCMFPVYTFIDLKEESSRDENGGLLQPMFGDNWKDFIETYNVAAHITTEYPPCYIVCGKDDTTVPCRNSELMKELLDLSGVPAVLEEGKHAQHGFGDGTGTDVEGWPQRAMRFLSEVG